MTISQKIEIFPNREQRERFSQYFGTRRWCWNKALEIWNTMYAEVEDLKKQGFLNSEYKGLYPNNYKVRDRLKEQLEDWFYENSLPKQLTDTTVEDIENAFRLYRQHKKKTNGKGRPQFKSKHKSIDTCRFYKKNDASIRIVDGKLALPKMSKKVEIRRFSKTGRELKPLIRAEELLIVMSEPIKCNKATDIKTCTITRTKTNRYFVCITFEKVLTKSACKPKKTVGIDLGLKTFATLAYDSENQRVYESIADRSAEIKKLHKERDKLNKKLSFKTKPSKRRDRLILALNKNYEKISNIKHDFLHKETTRIVRRFKIICIEDLKLQNMIKNHNLAESIARSNFYEFKEKLLYKAELYGNIIILANAFYPSTQTCSYCGHVKVGEDKLKLNDRQYICHICGIIEDRDENAAYNLKNYADQLLKST